MKSQIIRHCLGILTLALSFHAGVAGAQQEPLRLGFLTVRSGPLAAGGRQMEEGIQFFLKERGYILAGRKVELIVADTAGSPPQAKAKTQELVEKHKVHAIIGPLATSEALAIDDYIKTAQVPLITPTSAAQNDLAQKKQNDFVVHAMATAAQPTHVMGDYAAKQLALRRISMIADDFAYGHESAAGFHASFESAAGKVIQKMWPPLNVADYGSYVTQIKKDVDGLYAGFAGINGLRFLKQLSEYGRADKPIVGNASVVDEGVLRSMGDEALGVYSASWYSAALETPENKRFVDGILAEFKVVPGSYTIGTYVSGMFLEAALRSVAGNTHDRQALAKALRSVRLEKTPMGPVRIDEYGKPVLNIYVRKVERKGGRLVNSIVATYPNVTQFWSFDQKQFAASPGYSRDQPPAKHLEP